MLPHREPPSAWVTRWAPLIRSGGRVLDLACGHGRHARWLAEHGWQVLAVDRDAEALAVLGAHAGIETRQVDLEQGRWPFADQQFDGIVVCRYLHRPLLPLLPAALKEGAVLIYETFMQGQETLGRPRNPDFLLRQDELIGAYSRVLRIEAFEQGRFEVPVPVFLQRLCATR